MERAKAERKVARYRFTTCANKLETLFVSIEKDSQAITVEFNRLSAIYSDLSSAQNKVLNLWLDDEERDESQLERDIDTAEEYVSRWYSLEQKVKTCVELNNSDSFSKRTLVQVNEERFSTKGESRRHFRLPKLELPSFSGDIKGWLAFWTQFKKIHNDDSIDNDDKLQYLRQCMELGSSARELVESFPPSGDNYLNAVEQLKQRFAKDEVIVEHYVRELLQLVLAQAKGLNQSSIRFLYDKINTQILALDTLGVTKDKYAAFLRPLVESTLPEDLLKAWSRAYNKTDNDEGSTLSKLLDFVKREVESEERVRIAKAGFSTDIKDPAQPSTSCFTTFDKQNSSKGNHKQSMDQNTAKMCLFCERNTHVSSECVTAVNKSLDDRIDIVKRKKACGICLNTGHYWKKCRKHPKCVICGKRHFPIMCSSMKQKTADEKRENEPIAVTQSVSTSNNKIVLLQTLKLKIMTPSGVITVRALLDSGAQRSFIKSSIVKKLNLKPIGQQDLSHCLFGGTLMKKQSHNLYNVNVSSLDNNYLCNIDVLEQDVICGYLPQIRQGELLSKLNNLGIFVTDCTDNNTDISMLIGSDVLGSLFTGRAVQVDSNLLAVETKLGWTVQGPAVGVYCSVNNVNALHCTFSIDDFWKLETIGIRDDAETKSQTAVNNKVMKFFEETIHVNEEHRYEVRLPWKDTPKTLQPNFSMALKRLNSTTIRLSKLGIMKDYDAVFEEWLKDGIIEEVQSDDPNTGHYLPHHAVIKHSSLTTKIRPVFDASSKDLNGISLNSCLEKGINLIEIIPKLLINFRRNAIGITADIKKAFLQIALHSDDRKYLKFLWWQDINSCKKNLKVFRHQRVVFGVTTSPFHLSATILHHLNKYNSENAAILKRSFYVDNCIVSVKNENDMYNFISEAKDIMKEGQFELRCWVTGPFITDTETRQISVLGLMWDPLRDELFCKPPSTVSKHVENGFTKRNILSLGQSIFDPIGCTSPVTLIPKLVIQKCWIRNLDWDQLVPQELQKIMNDWIRQIQLLESCRIPRCISHADLDVALNTLHVFCDASQSAYACCVYLRSDYGNKVSVKLILAKSRVAPTKRITMPRLELIAALMGTRLMSEVKKGLNVKCKEFYWTDSSIVLAWLKRKDGLNVFVQNRVVEISERSDVEDWRHVPGDINPADLPSRGCNAEKLLQVKWWLGPEWLYKSPQEWPQTSEESDHVEVLKEMKKDCLLLNHVIMEKFSDCLTYFSKYTKIVRMVGWCLRFVHKCLHKTNMRSGEICAVEYVKAEKCLLQIIQAEDIVNLISKVPTFKEDDNLLRVKTRLTASDNVQSFKTPIVLTSKNVIVERLVRQKHEQLLHAGSQTLISSLRETYWIMGIRKLAKKIVKECAICQRFSAKACTVPPAPLPNNRVRCGNVFEVSGVDLAGPLFLKSGQKCWIVLFTCATYRAVHLEITRSLSTEDFMLSLRRFLARRGKVRIIYSDNGTNFRGTSNVLNSVNWQEIAQRVSVQEIEWRFIPPSAPWWGGFWERMVKTLKQIMRRVLGKAALHEVELQTVLCEAEAVINARPLTYIADNTEFLRPLTPKMFLNTDSGNEVDFMDQVDGNILTSRWRYLNTINAQLKQRFRSEYLSLLTEYSNHKPYRNVQVGDVVLVGSDYTKRVHWPLGIILEVYPGIDKHGRVARVKTATGERVRALQRLYRLEVSSSDAIVPETSSSDTNSTRTRSGRSVRLPERLNL